MSPKYTRDAPVVAARKAGNFRNIIAFLQVTAPGACAVTRRLLCRVRQITGGAGFRSWHRPSRVVVVARSLRACRLLLGHGR